MITQLSSNLSILCNFLIPHWQSELFAFTPAEFEQDKRPGELCLGSATSSGCDGCCSSHMSVSPQDEQDSGMKGTLLTFVTEPSTPFIHSWSQVLSGLSETQD